MGILWNTTTLQVEVGMGSPCAHSRDARDHGQWISYSTPLHFRVPWVVGLLECLVRAHGVVGGGHPLLHCCTTGDSGYKVSFSTMLHCRGSG